MRQIMLVLLLLTGGLSYGEQMTVYMAQKGILEGAEQPRFRFRGYIAPGYGLKSATDIDYAAIRGVSKQAEGENWYETNQEEEMPKIQAVYEQISSAAEKTGQGIVVRWTLGDQRDVSHINIPESLTVTDGDDEKVPVVWLSSQIMRHYGDPFQSGLDSSGWAVFPQDGRKDIEQGPFFGFSGSEQLSNSFNASYGETIGGDEPEKIKEQYSPFSRFSGLALEEAEISGFWTVDETEATDQGAIRYFEFSEPIGGGGGGGGSLFVPYRKMEGIEADNSVMESMPSSYVQPNRSYWRKSLNYGKSPASVFVSPSQVPENTGFSGSWGGFRLGN